MTEAIFFLNPPLATSESTTTLQKKKCGYYTAYIQLVNYYSDCFGWNSERKQEVEVNVNGEINEPICMAFMVKKDFLHAAEIVAGAQYPVLSVKNHSDIEVQI